MKISLSNKLFAGFALLSLLTIISGATTFVIIEKMASSQRSIKLLQDFELTIYALEDTTTTQSLTSKISSDSYDRFLENLEKSRDLANEILLSGTCLAVNTARLRDNADSCQTIMREVVDSYPQIASYYFEKTLFTISLIEKSRRIYEKMIEAANQNPKSSINNQLITSVNNLEILQHRFERYNSQYSIEEMKSEYKNLLTLSPEPNLVNFARLFISNTEQIYLNRLDIEKNQIILKQNTERFIKTSMEIYQDIIGASLKSQKQIRTLIILLSFSSVVMTILFWMLTARRLSRFLLNQRNAINSIKSGDYDYSLKMDSHDELSELCDFTKSLAINLKEEISERQFSQQKKETLQFQLMKAQRHESIGMLTGGIAHDFNNILTGITGYTDLALARLEDNNPVKKYLEIISQSGQQAAEMTRKLLALSKKQETGKQIVDINAMLSKLFKIMNRMIGEEIVLELDKSSDLANVMADTAQIEQVLMNLAVNAKDAMPDGGKLTIRTSVATLGKSEVKQTTGVDPGNFVKLSISDNGTGMTDEIREQVFDPSFTTKSSSRGTGLGLSTVAEIIKGHNGLITVDSTLGQGTTINIFLPVIDAALKLDIKQTISDPCIIKGHETILLVDDNDTARDFICETLEYCGYKLLTANSGNKAVTVMNHTDYPIDLLLTDVIMPGMNGMKLAEIAKKENPDVKVLFMSGYEDLPDDHELNGFNSNREFLKKPMSIEKLSSKVRETLDN